MQLFEDSIRARRRAARLKAQRKKRSSKPKVKKREISAQERFKRARELIAKNYSTNQISKMLNISERSVTRFKKRIREEKRKLRIEGKIEGDPDDDSSFKFLTPREKISQIRELLDKNLKFNEISAILKISERSVRRWKDRLMNKKVGVMDSSEIIERTQNDADSDLEDFEDPQENAKSKHPQRRSNLSREKVQYAAELVENGLSNKEMSMLLEMSVACVRKLKTKILNGTAEELIDDAEEHYKNINSDETGADPLDDISEVYTPTTYSPKTKCERKAKVNLSEKDMFVVRLLREQDVRTMDIARMVGICERSVTRLLSKSKDMTDIVYEQDVVDEVERLLASRNDLSCDFEANEPSTTSAENDESKENIALSLLAMNVKVTFLTFLLLVFIADND